MHKLLSRQIKLASEAENINYDKLLDMISITYTEIEQSKKLYVTPAESSRQDLAKDKQQTGREAEQIGEILNSMDQIIFTFNQDLSINSQFSSKAQDFFGLTSGEQHSIIQAFKLKSDQIETFQTWVNNLFIPSTLRRWQKIVEISPFRELRLEEGDQITILELDYKPIIQNKKLASIIVTARDVTRSRRIAAELSKQKQLQLRHSENVDAFFSNSQVMLQLFLKELSELNHCIIKSKETVNSNQDIAAKIADVEELYCAVHTVKSSAGTYGFNYLAAICHRVENNIDSYLKRKEDRLFSKQFEELVEEIHTIKRFWNQLCEYNSSVKKIKINKQSYYQLIKELKDSSKPDYAWIIEGLEDLEAIEEMDFSGKYHRIFNNIKEAQNLSMKTLNIEIPKGKIKRGLAEALDPILIHLIKNAIDHGFENKIKQEKTINEPGQIDIIVSESDEEYKISVKDNGQGIDPKKIAEAAIEKKIISEQDYKNLSDKQKMELIFAPQLSTKKKVSLTSGRGIGMYSVKSSIEKLAGEIKIISEVSKGTEFIFRIPKASINQVAYTL